MPASHNWAQIESFSLAVLTPAKPKLSLRVFSPPFTSSNTSVALPQRDKKLEIRVKKSNWFTWTNRQKEPKRLTWCVWRSWNRLFPQQTLQCVWEMGAGCEKRPVPNQPVKTHGKTWTSTHGWHDLNSSTDGRHLLAGYLKFLLWTGGGGSPQFCRCRGDLANQASALGRATSHKSSKKFTKLPCKMNGVKVPKSPSTRTYSNRNLVKDIFSQTVHSHLNMDSKLREAVGPLMGGCP